VLYIFGGEGVHLFAFVMVMGVIVGTYSSIYIAAPLLLMFGEGKAKPGQAAIDKPTERERSATQASAATS
jgi:SecD/SecF fusion protein